MGQVQVQAWVSYRDVMARLWECSRKRLLLLLCLYLLLSSTCVACVPTCSVASPGLSAYPLCYPPEW